MPGIEVKVSADSSGVKTGLAQAQERINEFKESAKESFADVGKDFIGIFAVGSIVEGFRSIFEEFARVGQLAKQAGESAENFERVGQAAEKSGVDMELLSKSIKNVTVAAVEALEGSKEMAEAFDTLNINTVEFVDLPITEKVEALSDAYNTAGSNADKLAAINKILSKGGKELIPLLEEGSDALRQEFAEANVASNQTVEDIEKAEEKWKDYFNNLKVFGADAIDVLIKAWGSFINIMKLAGSYLANIPKGFSAASQAASEEFKRQVQEIKESNDKLAKEEEERTANKGKTAEAAAKRELAEQQAEDEKKSAKEIAELQAENDKKREEARLRHLSLMQREAELQDKINALAAENVLFHSNKEDVLKRDNQRLDLQKELDQVQDQMRRGALEKDKQAAREKAKADLDAKRETLEQGQELLRTMEEKFKPITVDSLKSVGGSIGRVNYNAVLPRQNAEREAIEHQKQAVDQLKKIVRNTEKTNQQQQQLFVQGDGSFGES